MQGWRERMGLLLRRWRRGGNTARCGDCRKRIDPDAPGVITARGLWFCGDICEREHRLGGM